MDDDGSKSLSFLEFKKAMREFGVQLTETEIVVLFKRFDMHNSGSVSYDSFMQVIAGRLNKRRRRLVNLAFDVLDKDGSGLIDIKDIAMAYDVSLHPDFLAGKKAEDILLEFLDNFDVGVKDGVVTRQEFENYYSTLSCSITRDDYFELMIRNAWHISGGEGAAANSANRRVLVTRADGTQYVEEIKDDMGVGKDQAALRARLQAQGVGATNIELYGAGEDNGQGVAAKKGAPPTGATGGGTGSKRGKKSKGRGAKGVPAHVRVEPSPGLKLIIAKIKGEMKARGSGGFIGLQRRFRIMDDDGSKSLDVGEFKKALRELKMDLSEADLRALFEYFDADGSGFIDFEEFVQGVRDPLCERRLALVDTAFSLIDKDGSGEVDAREIASIYDASRHPEVLAKRKSVTQVLEEFLDTFDVGGVKDGIVTRAEFANYYANLSASINNDDYFELMMRNAWHISGGEGASASSTNLRCLVTDSSGNERSIEIKNDLGLRKDDIQGMYERLKAQGVKDIRGLGGKMLEVRQEGGREVVKVVGPTSGLSTNEFSLPQREVKAPFRAAAAAPGSAPYTATRAPAPGSSTRAPALGSASARAPAYGPFASTAPASALNQPHTLSQSRPTLANKVMAQMDRTQSLRQSHAQAAIVGGTLLDVLRVQLLTRGPAGIIELQRKFVEMDIDGSKSLDYAEFKVAVLQNGLAFSETQLRSLFAHFDADGSGEIDYDELLYGLRGSLPPTLLVLVHQIFDLLDVQGVDSIEPQALISHFDASRHPEVQARVRTEAEIMAEFLDTFDVGGEQVGRITRSEFVRYYTNISASFNDDSYFETVLRKVWHVPATAEGAGAAMAAYRAKMRGDKAESSLAAKLRQATQGTQGTGSSAYAPVPAPATSASARRPSSASATRRPSMGGGTGVGMGGGGGGASQRVNFASPRTGSPNQAEAAYGTFGYAHGLAQTQEQVLGQGQGQGGNGVSRTAPARPQSAGPMGRGGMNRSYVAPAPAPAPAQADYGMNVGEDMQDELNEESILQEAKALQKSAIFAYNAQQYPLAMSQFQEVLEVLALLLPPGHPELVKAQKSVVMTERKVGTGTGRR